MDEEGVVLLRGGGEVGDRFLVQQVGEIDVAFGFIHRGVGRRVDEEVHVFVLHHPADGGKVGDVQGVHIGEKKAELPGMVGCNLL